ncbi:iron permease FTR1 [Vararia minispora EC-137]|uniref:Iron permease FTR1 n=1 Tax=Vararia minispora EC-137 TaxID=1314806 RepID=A0ACB8QK74_9AGAM|nr:iron permease FTR1 [Vararia minispora EC-137]
MARNLFSVPIFFIVFREVLEAAIIVSVLLGLVEQIVLDDSERRRFGPQNPETVDASGESSEKHSADNVNVAVAGTRRLIRKMRIQIFAGALIGLFIALAIGAAFIAVWFTQASNLWSTTENLWEGVFSLIAAIIIFIMGITMLKLDRAKAKWRVKLMHAFNGQRMDRGARTSKWTLFILPFITVLREAMEAIVFVGGVSLGQPASSIPIAAIVGIICGLVCGYLIYAFASRSALTVFLVVMTNLVLLIGAGLFSKATWLFQENAFTRLLGKSVDDTGGDGPGSYNVVGNVWHLDCCNPKNPFDSNGWNIFNSIFGWTNSATLGSVLSYVFYWVAVIVVLVYLKFKEGRTKLFGFESAAGKERRIRRERAAATAAESPAEKEE